MEITNREKGKRLRKEVSRKLQAKFELSPHRLLVVDMITATNADRIPELIPIRHARMSTSPFAFYRGTAGIMAGDLSRLPHTNTFIQVIGDCHLMNFGGFATPERTLVFDANDFDETNPAPWEWDLKRLTTSFVLAARDKQMDKHDAKEMAFIVAESYMKHMAAYSSMTMLDLWYMKFDLETMVANAKSPTIKSLLEDAIAKAHKDTHQNVLYKLTQKVLGSFEIADQPPLVYHTFDVQKDKEMVNTFLEDYFKTLQKDRHWLASQYKVVDVALKVVGVGSVGTRCYVALMMNQKEEPLFLQIKEARPSVLEPYTAPSQYKHNGQRVIEGQRLIQAASDIFLGWSTGPEKRHFFIRQLRDRKIAPNVALFNKSLLQTYAHLCGRMLARAHAKTGNASLISAYMGKSKQFNEAISDFSIAYANQTEKDYDDFIKAIRTGKLEVAEEP